MSHACRAGPRRTLGRGGIGVPHVIVAGAGYAGLAAYLALRPAAERGEIALTVVNADDRHLLLPELPMYLVGEAHADRIRLDLRHLVREPARLLLAQVVGLDPAAPALACAGSTGRLTADAVILALGSVSDDFGVPGVAEHATAIGQWHDILVLRANLLDDLSRRTHTSVAVVGGGFTGVEIATELAERARDADDGLTVHLIAPRLLPALPPRAQATAEAAVRQLGIRWRQTHATRVHGDSVEVEGGERVAAATVVWAAGVRANPVVARSGLRVDGRGRALVDAAMRAAPHVFVAGDCAAPVDPRSGRALPPRRRSRSRPARWPAAMPWRNLPARIQPPSSPRSAGSWCRSGAARRPAAWRDGRCRAAKSRCSSS